LCWLRKRPYLGNQGFGHTQFLQSLVEGFSRPLGLTPVVCEAFMRLEATALSGFGWLFGVSLAGGHRVLLQTVVLAIHGKKETMSPKE
jgi:hypothetical protein